MTDDNPLDPIIELLNDPAVAEQGGEHGNEGTDFVRFWAIALLIELERAKLADYALAFEFLQDVAVLDSPSRPTKATLYQLKKKLSGKWTRARLCKIATDTVASSGQKKGATKLGGSSPLGKLYLCVEKLSQCMDAEGVFLSDGHFELKLEDGSAVEAYTRIGFLGLHEDDRKFIRAKLCKELGLKDLPAAGLLGVDHSKITPISMRETVRGIIDGWLCEQFPTLPNVAGRLQETLLHKFSQLSGFKPGLDSWEKVISAKGFTRNDFNKLLEKLSHLRSADSILTAIIPTIVAEGMGARHAERLRQNVSKLQIRLVRHPEMRDTLRLDEVIELARGCDASGYLAAINQIRAQMTGQGFQAQNSLEADALALLGVIYAEEELAAADQEFEVEVE